MTLDITPQEAHAFLSSLKDYDFLEAETGEALDLITLVAKLKTVQ